MANYPNLSTDEKRREDNLVKVTRLQEGQAHLNVRLDGHDEQFGHIWVEIKQLRDRLPVIPTVLASLTMSAMAAVIGYLIKWVEVLK